MLKDFKAFLFRGNLLDLATAVVLGVAFNSVIQSLVKDVVTPIVAAIGGQPNFDSLTLDIGDGVIRYGTFLNALVNFLIIAAVIFLLLRAATRAQKLRASSDAPDEDTPPPSDEVLLLSEIRDLLKTR